MPAGIELNHIANYLLVALLAAIAGLIGILFKNVLYKTEDLCDRVWGSRPDWARPAVGGVVLGLLLLALPQLYGVGYPVMYAAFAHHYAIWFLVLLAAGKMLACSLTIGIGGSGGVFAPSLFVGATSGMAFGLFVQHTIGTAVGHPALYAIVGMGAVFASATRAPLTALASTVEMTGDFTLTLPVMLAVAVGTTVSRGVSYGTIYTTKLLRRGIDIDRPTPTHAFADLTAADAMHRFAVPLDLAHPAGDGHRDLTGMLGPVTRVREPQALFANDSLAQALRQLVLYGRDGLPVIDTEARSVQGWLTNQNVLRAVGAYFTDVQPDTVTAPRPPNPPARHPRPKNTIHTASSRGITSSNTPWPATRSPSAEASATWTGRPATSPSRCCTTGSSSMPTPPYGSPRATGSTFSHPNKMGTNRIRRPAGKRYARCSRRPSPWRSPRGSTFRPRSPGAPGRTTGTSPGFRPGRSTDPG